MSPLHSEQEITVLKVVRELKNKQFNEAEERVNVLISGEVVIVHKQTYYDLREFMNGLERTHMDAESAPLVIQAIKSATQCLWQL